MKRYLTSTFFGLVIMAPIGAIAINNNLSQEQDNPNQASQNMTYQNNNQSVLNANFNSDITSGNLSYQSNQLELIKLQKL